jgi:hypothetical protein
MLWSNGALNWKDELKKYPLLVDQTDTIKKFKDRFATCFFLQGQIKSFYLKEISLVSMCLACLISKKMVLV